MSKLGKEITRKHSEQLGERRMALFFPNESILQGKMARSCKIAPFESKKIKHERKVR